jgi:hypothetical protein
MRVLRLINRLKELKYILLHIMELC